ncbi:MAG: hypothetical protein M0R34_01375 [Candidatus Marinimicrobia bacterium]|nr:hypothetical protein [Candidatus Neomarinimicrobiota bacterium]
MIIGFMSILVLHNLKVARIITNFDIARWYLDSDLVLICSTNKIDTLFLSHHDYYTPDSLRLTYDLIREIYHIDTDSVIKPCNNRHISSDSICSQDFSINYAKTKQGEDNKIYRLNELGDTVGVDTFKTMIMYNDDYSDNSYFRLENNKKHLVILSSNQHGYMIDYETEISDWILELIAEVKNKGQSYIDDFFKMD